MKNGGLEIGQLGFLGLIQRVGHILNKLFMNKKTSLTLLIPGFILIAIGCLSTLCILFLRANGLTAPEGMLLGLILSIGAFLIIVEAFDPDTITKLWFGKSGVERRVTPPEEKKVILENPENKAADKTNEKFEKIVKHAQERDASQRSVEDYLALGTSAWRVYNLDDGLNYIFSGLALNPDDKRVKASLFHRLGQIYRASGEVDLAMLNLHTAIRIDPAFSWPHNVLGMVHNEEGNFDMAEKSFKEAISLEPKNGGLYINLGNLYLNYNKKKDAKKVLKEFLEFDPKGRWSMKAKELLRTSKGNDIYY